MANTISTQNSLGSIAANSPAPVDGARQTAAQQTAKASPQGTAHKTDQASLSTVGGLVAKASAGSDVRTEKVAALQSQIAAGTYHVPAHAVAGKIVDSLLS